MPKMNMESSPRKPEQDRVRGIQVYDNNGGGGGTQC